jgi:hypothetical protein
MDDPIRRIAVSARGPEPGLSDFYEIELQPCGVVAVRQYPVVVEGRGGLKLAFGPKWNRPPVRTFTTTAKELAAMLKEKNVRQCRVESRGEGECVMAERSMPTE